MDRLLGSALRFVTIAAIVLLPLPGQSAVPSPAETTEIAKDLEGRGPVIRFDVNLVQVDVVVTDRSGHHIAGLTPSEFEVFQNGKRKAITHFEYVPMARLATADTPAARPYAPHPQPTREEVRRSFLLYIDDVRISFLDFALVRKALLRFVDTQVNEGDICALYRTSGGPAQANEFTSDPRRLRNSIERMHWQHSPPIFLEPACLVNGLTLAIRAMAPLPGRKTIVLVNSGFYGEDPRVVKASGKDPFDYPDPRVPFDLPPEEIWKMTDRANRAGVVIGTIDARGLSVSEAMADYWRAASEPGIITNPTSWPKLWFRDMEALDLGKSLAGETGGLFLHNQNDLERALKTIADDSEGYYLVGWNPGNEVFERAFGMPKYFPISIRVPGRGYRVRTRTGFFGTPYDLRPNAPVTVAEQMNEALFSPFARKEIDVEVSSSFQHNGVEGSYIESLVRVGKTGLTFHEAEKGCRTARLELLTMARPLVRGPHEPEIVESHMGTAEACDSTKALESGFVFELRSKVSKPGPYEVRVAVRNVAHGQEAPSFARADKLIRRDDFKPLSLGSANVFVEVPDLQKNQLALSGIRLMKDSVMATVDEQPEKEFLYRAAVDGDPAIRYFHAGDVLRYTLRRFGACDGCTGSMTIYRAGNVVDQEPLALTGDVIQGMYRLEASAAADHYMLQVVVSRAHDKNQKAAAVQSIDFAVEPLN